METIKVLEYYAEDGKSYGFDDYLMSALKHAIEVLKREGEQKERAERYLKEFDRAIADLEISQRDYKYEVSHTQEALVELEKCQDTRTKLLEIQWELNHKVVEKDKEIEVLTLEVKKGMKAWVRAEDLEVEVERLKAELNRIKEDSSHYFAGMSNWRIKYKALEEERLSFAQQVCEEQNTSEKEYEALKEERDNWKKLHYDYEIFANKACQKTLDKLEALKEENRARKETNEFLQKLEVSEDKYQALKDRVGDVDGIEKIIDKINNNSYCKKLGFPARGRHIAKAISTMLGGKG